MPPLACLLACSIISLFYFPPTLIFTDEQRYFASALRLATTGEFWVGADRAFEIRGTAFFFATVVWLFGPHAAIVPLHIAQSILVSVQRTLVASITQRIFGRTAAAFVASCIAVLPDEIARQRAYGKAALDYIQNNATMLLHAAAKKFVRFWNIVPNAADFR